MKRFLAALATILATAAFAAPAQAAPSDFGIESLSAGLSTVQAGGHPDFTVSFELKTDPSSPVDPTGLHAPYARIRDLTLGLPPGLIGNPNAVAQCTPLQFATALVGGGCPQDSQVGIVVTRIYSFNYALTEPIYNMSPPEGGGVARFGFYVATAPVTVDAEVRSEGDYGIDTVLRGVAATEAAVGAETTIWGNPADPSHDTERLTVEEAFAGGNSAPPRKSGLDDPRPFLTNPTRCGVAQQVFVEADSYLEPGRFSRKEASLPPLSGCGSLTFQPTFSATPTTREAAAPSGLDAELEIPQNETVDGLATSQLRDASVILPSGMTISSSAAAGMEACSAEQVGLGTRAPANCPPASKIGTAEFDVPALSRVVEGALYQRTPRPGNLFGVWLVSDELGAHVKIAGEIDADPLTGQVSSLFLDNPQVPLENLKLHFFSGPGGVLATPASCGTHFTHYEFAPWSGRPPVSGEAPMTIDQDCGAGGFSPALRAGTTNPTAGAFSPFALTLTRPDKDQNISGLQVRMPAGLLAKLAGVGLCPEAQVPSGDCPASAQLGTATVAAGPGSAPLWVPQPGKSPTAVYLTGPYKGAPYGLAVKVPAQAGPFDLGTVVTRAAIEVDPETTQVTVKSDPLPQILEGVPVTYRTIHVDVDRPNFILNPTGCRPRAVRARVTSVQGAVAEPQDRFQAASCASLGFGPKLALKLKGGTKRNAYPALRAELRARPGDANIAKASVALPHSQFLEQAHIRTICTRVQFAADACPAAAVYGKARAFTPLLDQPLEGPVYLRSSDNPLPDLVADLRGPIDVVVAGRIDTTAAGGIRTTFGSVPDAPVTRFVLSMQGGKKGLLVNSRNLCRGKNRAEAAFTAQNGKRRALRPVVKNSCAKQKGKKGKRRANPRLHN